MGDNTTRNPSNRFQVDPDAQSRLAWMRTPFAAERTMMVCMRTAVSLIGLGLGLAIFQFFCNFAAIAGMASEPMQTPLYAITGVMVCVGIFAFFAVLLRFEL